MGPLGQGKARVAVARLSGERGAKRATAEQRIGPRGRRGGGGRATAGLSWAEGGSGPSVLLGLGWFQVFLPLFFFLVFNFTQTIELKFEFEFNPSTQTNETMLQHECTNMLALK